MVVAFLLYAIWVMPGFTGTLYLGVPGKPVRGKCCGLFPGLSVTLWEKARKKRAELCGHSGVENAIMEHHLHSLELGVLEQSTYTSL